MQTDFKIFERKQAKWMRSNCRIIFSAGFNAADFYSSYSHYDRMIIGGVVRHSTYCLPNEGIKNDSFLREESGIINEAVKER
jgi:5-keto 4-deoxyuronate isomerase